MDDVTPGMAVVLADGTRIRLRPILARDKARLRQAMGDLSSLSRRHRFFSAQDDLDDEQVSNLTEIDFRSRFA